MAASVSDTQFVLTLQDLASAGEQALLIGGTDQRSRKPLDRLFDGLRWAAYDAVKAGFSGFLPVLRLSVVELSQSLGSNQCYVSRQRCAYGLRD